METDYTKGDKPVPVGTIVEYFGSQEHGTYKIDDVRDPGNHPYRRYKNSGTTPFYPDGVAYDLWPVGVTKKFGNRDRAILYVRRTSFRVHQDGEAASSG